MGRGAYRPYFVRASQVLLCDMLQRRAKREVVCIAPPSQGRVHRHHAGLLVLEFRAWGPSCRWFSVTHGLSINLELQLEAHAFFSFLIGDSSCFFFKHRGVATHSITNEHSADEADVSLGWWIPAPASRFLSFEVRARHKVQLGFSKKPVKPKTARRARCSEDRLCVGTLQSPFSLHFPLRDS